MMEGSSSGSDRGVSPPRQPHDRSGWPAAILASVVILAVYLFSASRSSLWDRDEPRYARATVEMIESGNYLYPTFNGELRPHKPILIYWLMSVPVHLLGPTELACRLISGLATAAACLLTWYMGRTLFGHRAGLWAMGVLASSLLMLAIGKLATTDAALLALTVAAFACFAASLTHGVRAIHLLLLAGATGLAMLTKGPLGLVPLGVIAAAILLGRRSIRLGGRYVLLALLATLGGAAMFCAWGVPANIATGGEFFRLGVGYHVVARSAKALESHGAGSWGYLLWLPYYLPVVLIGFFPWVLHLPGAVSATLGGRLGGAGRRAVLGAMTAPIFVVMTLVATKLPHYILSMWPAMALAVGATIQAHQRGELSPRDLRWLRRGVWPLAILGAAGGLAALIGPWLLPLPDLRIGATIVGLGLLAMTFLAARAHFRRGPAASAKVLLAGMVAVELALHVAVAPAVEQAKNVPELAAGIKAAAPAEVPVATYGFYEPSLNFYLGRMVHTIRARTGAAAQALAWLDEPADGVLVVTGRRLEELESVAGPIDAERIASVKTFNPTKCNWIELIALRRRAPAAPALAGR